MRIRPTIEELEAILNNPNPPDVVINQDGSCSVSGETVTHIAGPAITACGRCVQRCSLCGYKLCDSKGKAAPLNPDGTPPGFPTWEVGRLVRVTSGNPTEYELLEDTDKLPDDSCLALLE